MVLYVYPLILGCFCALMICVGLWKREKKVVVFFSIIPCFFASPFFTFTRGAAGGITASDFTGLMLLACLFFIPAKWKGPYAVWPVKLLALWMIIMGVSIWTSGLYNNSWGVNNAKLENIRLTARFLLPVLIAGYRFIKLLTLYAYFAFFSRLIFDADEVAFLMRTIIFGCVVLSVAKALTASHIIDLSLAYGNTYSGHIGPRILGQTKACAGRFISIGIILCLAQIRDQTKIAGLSCIMILSAGLVLTGSRGAMGALFVGVIFILLMDPKRGLLIGGIGLIVVIISGLCVLHYDETVAQRLLLSFNSENLATASKRIPIWSKTLSVWLDRPSIILFGVGAFNFAYAILSIGFETAHNDLLTIGSELGLASVMIFVAWIFSMCTRFFNNIRQFDGKEKWYQICAFAVFAGLVFAGQFEATLYPTISTLPMLRVAFSLLLAVGLYRHKQAMQHQGATMGAIQGLPNY